MSEVEAKPVARKPQRVCACGCGEPLPPDASERQKYIFGHRGRRYQRNRQARIREALIRNEELEETVKRQKAEIKELRAKRAPGRASVDKTLKSRHRTPGGQSGGRSHHYLVLPVEALDHALGVTEAASPAAAVRELANGSPAIALAAGSIRVRDERGRPLTDT